MASPCSTSEPDDAQSGSVSTSTKQLASAQQDGEKVCKICSDRAVGYNFSVISCESCKAFFRRNASRAPELKCPFTNNCEMNTISRRFCQSCRLNKCFEVGMKKEWILIERNRRSKKRRLTSIPNTTDDINKMLEEIGDGEVTVTKMALLDLVKKSNSAGRLSECQCKCTCGFYSPETVLTAAASPTPSCEPSPRQLPNLPQTSVGLLANIPATSMINTLPVNTISGSEADRPTTDIRGYDWPWQAIPSRYPCPDFAPTTPQPKVEWNVLRTPGIVSPSLNGVFPSPRAQLPPSTLPYLSPTNVTSQLPIVNAVNTSIYSEFETPSCSVETITSAPNRSLNHGIGTVAMPAVQPSDVLVTLDQYSRLIDSTNRAAETHSSILALPTILSDRERFLMQELIIANSILKQPVDVNNKQPNAGDLTLMDVVRMTDLALRRIINFAKEISTFREISQDDQIALLKGSCSELLILRGVMVFDPTKDVWNHHVIQGSSGVEIKLEVLKGPEESQHYEEHKRFLTTFSEKWRRNENVMLLLNAITLFSPDRGNLKNAEIVRAKQLEYYQLLKTYLLSLCPPTEAMESFHMLLKKLIDLHQLNQGLLRIYYGLNIHEVDPLLLELFDLDKHSQ